MSERTFGLIGVAIAAASFTGAGWLAGRGEWLLATAVAVGGLCTLLNALPWISGEYDEARL